MYVANNINVHTQSVSIQPVPDFNPDNEVGASLATRWNTWIADFEMFITASDKKIRNKNMHYFCIKQDPEAKYGKFFGKFFDTGTDKDYDIAKAKLKEHFQPQKNRR